MAELSEEQKSAAEVEIAAKDAARPLTQKERIEAMEKAIAQLVENQNNIVQSLQSLNKQAPASPTSQNQLVPQLQQDKPAPLALDPSIFPALIKMLGFGGEPQQDPFHEAGKIMFESFANSIMQTSGRLIAKEARTIKHDHY